MEQTIHNFSTSLSKGEMGEKLVYDYLKTQSNIQDIVDLRDDFLARDKDIDFRIIFNSGKEQTVEIKTDFYKSANLFYEVYSSMETNSAGCFEKTEADRLMYYFYNMHILYIFDMPKFRYWVQQNRAEFEKRGYGKELKNSRYNGSTYTSYGLAIPRRLLEEENYPWVKRIDIDLESIQN